jgi:threonine/homoserine/homoserine lactone efflux protein
MSFEGWLVFALFWVVFVTTPGPNAVNCITNGMTHGFTRSLWGVLGILTQATLFLTLSALGVTALIAASPKAFGIAKLAGAALLIWLGLRSWINAAKPAPEVKSHAGSIYARAVMIATINPKSMAGYFAAFSQFVQPDVPIGAQMWAIFPTALVIAAMVYSSYTAIGATLGRAAFAAVFNIWLRRGMAICFIIYGVLLGLSSPPALPAGA